MSLRLGKWSKSRSWGVINRSGMDMCVRVGSGGVRVGEREGGGRGKIKVEIKRFGKGVQIKN